MFFYTFGGHYSFSMWSIFIIFFQLIVWGTLTLTVKLFQVYWQKVGESLGLVVSILLATIRWIRWFLDRCVCMLQSMCVLLLYKCYRHGSVHGLCSIHCAVVFLAFVFMITSFCGAIWWLKVYVFLLSDVQLWRALTRWQHQQMTLQH